MRHKMKKLFVLLLLVLCGCGNPDLYRHPESGILYAKYPACRKTTIAPAYIQRWDYELGIMDTYYPLEDTTRIRCNYNPYMYRVI